MNKPLTHRCGMLLTQEEADANDCPRCNPVYGVAAPLEPTQIAARKFRIEKGINDGTMMSGTWMDEVMAEFAGAVGRKPQEDISAADQAACTWIADAEFWRKEYESAAAVSKNLQEELAHAVSCMDRSCKRCNKVQLEIAALRETK